MKFEEPQLVVVGKARNVVLGPNNGDPGDSGPDPDTPSALDLGLDD